MDRMIRTLTLALGLITLMPLVASAHGNGRHRGHDGQVRAEQGKQHGKTKNGVPELDPGAAGAALILLAGGALALSERRRRRHSA